MRRPTEFGYEAPGYLLNFAGGVADGLLRKERNLNQKEEELENKEQKLESKEETLDEQIDETKEQQ